AGPRVGGRAPRRDGGDPRRGRRDRVRRRREGHPRAHQPRHRRRAGRRAARRARGGRPDLRRVRGRADPGPDRRGARHALRRHLRPPRRPVHRRRRLGAPPMSATLEGNAPTALPVRRGPERPTDAPAAVPSASAGRRRVLAAAAVPLALLGLWHLLTSVTGVFASYQLPAPAAVWTAGIELAADGTLWTHVAISTQRVLLGFAGGAAVGLGVG